MPKQPPPAAPCPRPARPSSSDTQPERKPSDNNSNRGVGSWGEVLGDTTVAAALLDRLLHRSVVLSLEGDSYRLCDHHARADTLRQTTTGTRQPLR